MRRLQREGSSRPVGGVAIAARLGLARPGPFPFVATDALRVARPTVVLPVPSARFPVAAGLGTRGEEELRLKPPCAGDHRHRAMPVAARDRWGCGGDSTDEASQTIARDGPNARARNIATMSLHAAPGLPRFSARSEEELAIQSAVEKEAKERSKPSELPPPTALATASCRIPRIERAKLRHQQVRETPHGTIEVGQWMPGYRLPSEKQLAARFGISPKTVRNAILHRQSRWLVRRIRAKRVFVADPPLLPHAEPRALQLPQDWCSKDPLNFNPTVKRFQAVATIHGRTSVLADQSDRPKRQAGLPSQRVAAVASIPSGDPWCRACAYCWTKAYPL
ncbi:MAG: GntR family transcriptional regulator [Fimbriimonadales bacterium]|nr:GntR family transcriptional regulator [Fimbriimonadales bacterium]